MSDISKFQNPGSENDRVKSQGVKSGSDCTKTFINPEIADLELYKMSMIEGEGREEFQLKREDEDEGGDSNAIKDMKCNLNIIKSLVSSHDDGVWWPVREGLVEVGEGLVKVRVVEIRVVEVREGLVARKGRFSGG